MIQQKCQIPNKLKCAQHISTSVDNKRGDKRPTLFTCTTFIVDLWQKKPTIRCQIPLDFSSFEYNIKASYQKKNVMFKAHAKWTFKNKMSTRCNSYDYTKTRLIVIKIFFKVKLLN